MVADLILDRAFQLASCGLMYYRIRTGSIEPIGCEQDYLYQFIAIDNRCVRFSPIYDLVVGRTHPLTRDYQQPSHSPNFIYFDGAFEFVLERRGFVILHSRFMH